MRPHEPPGRAVPAPPSLAHQYLSDSLVLRLDPTCAVSPFPLLSLFFDKSGVLQHRIARTWARGCVTITGARLTVQGAENLSQTFRRRLRRQPHLVYGYAGGLCLPAIPVPHPCEKRVVAHPLHRLASQPLRADSHRHRQHPRHAFQPSVPASGLSGAGRPLFVLPGRRAVHPPANSSHFSPALPFSPSAPRCRGSPSRPAGSTTRSPIHTRHFYPCDLTSPSANPSPPSACPFAMADELTARLRAAIEEMRTPPAQQAIGRHLQTPRRSRQAARSYFLLPIRANVRSKMYWSASQAAH